MAENCRTCERYPSFIQALGYCPECFPQEGPHQDERHRRRQGEHGPWHQDELLDVARGLGVVPGEFSEAEWRERLRPRKLGNRKSWTQKDWDRWNARSRRLWWELDAYCYYVLLYSLGALFREESVSAPPRIPPEIDFERLTVPPKVPKFDADEAAFWTYRHLRQKVSYPDLAKELERKRRHQLAGLTRRHRSERLVGRERGDVADLRQRLRDRQPPSARSIRRLVDENAHVWELAKVDLRRYTSSAI